MHTNTLQAWYRTPSGGRGRSFLEGMDGVLRVLRPICVETFVETFVGGGGTSKTTANLPTASPFSRFSSRVFRQDFP